MPCTDSTSSVSSPNQPEAPHSSTCVNAGGTFWLN